MENSPNDEMECFNNIKTILESNYEAEKTFYFFILKKCKKISYNYCYYLNLTIKSVQKSVNFPKMCKLAYVRIR